MTFLLSKSKFIGFISVVMMAAFAAWAMNVGRIATPAGWFLEQTREAGIVLDTLTIKGASKTRHSDILAALDVDDGMPMLAMNLDSMRAKLEALPWIKTAKISRSFPGELIVEIVERTPFAIWQNEGAFGLVDVTGHVITAQGLKAFDEMILIVGKGAPQAAVELQQILELEPSLRANLRSAIRVSARRWDMQFKNGIRVKLPEYTSNYSALSAWQRFASLEEEYHLLARELNIVDMRLKDRLVVSVTERGRLQMRGLEWVT